MRMQHVTNADALDILAHVTGHAHTEIPRFVAAPRALGANRREDGRITVNFSCHDSANDVTYIVEAPYADRVPQTHEQGTDMMLQSARAALEIAERIAKAVLN
jgi:hypothetical protein